MCAFFFFSLSHCSSGYYILYPRANHLQSLDIRLHSTRSTSVDLLACFFAVDITSQTAFGTQYEIASSAKPKLFTSDAKHGRVGCMDKMIWQKIRGFKQKHTLSGIDIHVFCVRVQNSNLISEVDKMKKTNFLRNKNFIFFEIISFQI